MTAALLGLVLAPAVYKFTPETVAKYDVAVAFEGFLPILGGNEGKAEVKMEVKVAGLAPDGELLRASNEITACEIFFNGGKLPLTLETIVDFFPKTTVGIKPNGEIVKNDAPDRNLPVRLPGLDVKRFPDITYLPIQFSSDEIAAGSTWTFSKKFGESDLNYTCTTKSVTGDIAEIDVAVKQEYEVMENEALEVVKKPEDAVSRVKTVMTGVGKIKFDLSKGLATAVEMKNSATSTAVDIKTKKETVRKLVTTLTVKLKADPATKVASRPATPPTWQDRLSGAWTSVRQGAVSLWQTGKGYAQLAWLAVTVGLRTIPGLPSWLGG